MGTPPAPAWATIFYALHEKDMVPRWSSNIMFYKRFIDDVIGIWLTDPDPDPEKEQKLWNAFCEDMDSWHDMKWDCNKPTASVNFMDLTITIKKDRNVTTLYEKALNLYLSSHPSHPIHVESSPAQYQVKSSEFVTSAHTSQMRILGFRSSSPDCLQETTYVKTLPLSFQKLRKMQQHTCFVAPRSIGNYGNGNVMTLITRFIFTCNSIRWSTVRDNQLTNPHLFTQYIPFLNKR